LSVLHVAVFKWKPGTTAGAVQSLADALDELKVQAVGLISYQHGADLGVRDGTFDYGVVAEFDSAEQIGRYLDHPLHQELVATYIAPILEERRAVQIQSAPWGP